jgi:excisionase family DNA binding protein
LFVSRDTLFEMRRRGEFAVPTFRIGRQIRVRRADVAHWLAQLADDADLTAQARSPRRKGAHA